MNIVSLISICFVTVIVVTVKQSDAQRPLDDRPPVMRHLYDPQQQQQQEQRHLDRKFQQNGINHPPLTVVWRPPVQQRPLHGAGIISPNHAFVAQRRLAAMDDLISAHWRAQEALSKKWGGPDDAAAVRYSLVKLLDAQKRVAHLYGKPTLFASLPEFSSSDDFRDIKNFEFQAENQKHLYDSSPARSGLTQQQGLFDLNVMEEDPENDIQLLPDIVPVSSVGVENARSLDVFLPDRL